MNKKPIYRDENEFCDLNPEFYNELDNLMSGELVFKSWSSVRRLCGVSYASLFKIGGIFDRVNYRDNHPGILEELVGFDWEEYRKPPIWVGEVLLTYYAEETNYRAFDKSTAARNLAELRKLYEIVR